MEIKYDTNVSIEVPVYKRGEIYGSTIIDKIDATRIGESRINARHALHTNYLHLYVTVNSTQWILSHFISGKPENGFVKDHKNRNVRDNRRCNLHDVTFSQNAQNKAKKIGGSSDFIGVSWNTQTQKWHVAACFDKKRIWLGCFDDEKEAGKMYDKFVIQKHGINASTNNLLTLEEIQMILNTPFILPERRKSSLGKNIYRSKDKFYTVIVDENGIKQSRTFQTHQEAINCRDSRLKEIADIKLKRILDAPIIRNSDGIAVIITNLKAGTQKEIKVNDKFYYEIMKFSWTVTKENPQTRMFGKLITLPKFVLDLAGKIQREGETIDHRNHDYTDCRIESLRYLNLSGQNQNKRKRKHKKHKFIGIYKRPHGSTFYSEITFQRKKFFLGTFDSDIKAAKAYDEAVDKYYPGGMRNFPKNTLMTTEQNDVQEL